jgi:hypothetical protein
MCKEKEWCYEEERTPSVFYSSLFNKRQTGDYEDFLDHNQEDVEALVEPARSLI